MTKDDDSTVCLWSANKAGHVQCLQYSSDEKTFEVKAEFDANNGSANLWTNKFVGLSCTRESIITCTDSGSIVGRSQLSGDIQFQYQFGNNLRDMQLHSNSSTIAIGGKEQELALYDLNVLSSSPNADKPVPIFKAKNVKNDKLDMRVPVDITNIRFMRNDGSNNEIVIGSAQGSIRVYDTRAFRRPVRSYLPPPKSDKLPIRTMTMVPGTSELMFADTMGALKRMDLSGMSMMGGYKGFAGTVTDIQCPAFNSKYVVSTSIDRHVRIHDRQSYKLLQKMYVRQRLSCVLVRSLEEDKDDESDDENVWDEMDTQYGLEANPSKKVRV